MSQALPQPISVPNPGTVVSYYHIIISSLSSLATLIGGHYYPPQSAQNLASSPGISHFIDGSGPIFSMYLGMAEEEDKKMAESWKADADGILIFVRPCFNPMHHTDSSVIDWSILRCCRILDLGVHSGHPTKPTGHVQLLPCQHLSDYCRPKSGEYFCPSLPTSIYSSNICRLGERALVP